MLLVLSAVLLTVHAMDFLDWESRIGGSPVHRSVVVGTELLAVVLAVAAVLRTRFSQWHVILGAAAVVAYSAADIHNLLLIDGRQTLSYGSFADAAYFAFYPLMFGAMAFVLRNLKGLAWPSLVDFGVGVLASAAITALFLASVIHPGTDGGTTFERFAPVMHPLFIIVLMAIFGGVNVSRDLDLGPRWSVLLTGMVLFTHADIVHLLGLQESASAVIGEAGWVLGIVCIAVWVDAVAGTVRTSGTRRVKMPDFAAPVLSTLTALTVLAIGCQMPISLSAQVLAISALALAVVPLVFRNRVLAALATTDELTGLPNRRALLTQVPAQLHAGSPGALFLLDLDRFKHVNDALGHDVGDALLIQVGRRFAGQLRPGDLLARLGGDEFAVFLEDVSEQEAIGTAQRLAKALLPPIEVGPSTLQIHASIGIALTPVHGTDLNLLMRKADVAMYRAKTDRSGHHLYSVLDDDGGALKLRTIQELRAALVEDQFEVHYQPKVSLEGHAVIGVEALVRWNHPVRGLLLPGSFLPLVEEDGLMPELTTLVLEHAVAQVAGWYADGVDITVAVNMSGSYVPVDLPRRIQELLGRHRMPAEYLVLEITEDILMTDAIHVAEVLQQLRTLGVQISIDDFGTGYSSLAYLRDLPVDELKLDRSFITAMRRDRRAHQLVGSIVDLAHSLDLHVVAEGVEDTRTAEDLRVLGCDLAQGFHFAAPLPADDVAPWIAAHPPQHMRDMDGTMTESTSGLSPILP